MYPGIVAGRIRIRLRIRKDVPDVTVLDVCGYPGSCWISLRIPLPTLLV